MDAHVIDLMSNFLVAVASGTVANLSSDAIKVAIRDAFGNRPDLYKSLQEDQSDECARRIAPELIGQIEARAGNGDGHVFIDEAVLRALRSIRFDHEHGDVRINNSEIAAGEVQFGGERRGSTGQTVITETLSTTQGTSVKVSGKGASIRLTGNATLKQK